MSSSFPGMNPFLQLPALFRGLHDDMVTYLKSSLQDRLPALTLQDYHFSRRISLAMLLAICSVAAATAPPIAQDESIGGQSKAWWESRLTATDIDTRIQAIRDLHRLPLAESSVLSLVLGATADSDPEVRALVARVLGDAEYSTASDPKTGIRVRPGYQMKSDDERRVIDALLNLAQDQDKKVRLEAANALTECGPQGIAPTLTLLESPRREVRWAGLKALGDTRKSKALRTISDKDMNAVVSHLLAVIRGPDSGLRLLSIYDVWQLDLGPREVKLLVRPIIDALQDQDEYVRDAATTTLRVLAARKGRNQFGIDLELSEEAKLAVAGLTALLKKDGCLACIELILALKNLGVDVSEQVKQERFRHGESQIWRVLDEGSNSG